MVQYPSALITMKRTAHPHNAIQNVHSPTYLNIVILFALWNFYVIIKLSTMRAGEYTGVGGGV